MANATATSNASVPGKPPAVSDGILLPWFTIFLIFTLIGSLLIILLIFIISTSKRLHSGAGPLVLHLLVVNLILSGFCQPVYLISTFMAVRGIPVHLDCTAVMFVRLVELCLECWAELCLAVNRFVAIILPHYYKWWAQKKVSIGMMVVSWVVCIVFFVPTFFGYGMLYGKFPPLFACTSRQTAGALMPIAMGVGMYFPLAAVGTIYITISLVFKVKKQALQNNRTQRRVKVAGMLFVSYLFNLVCYMPTPIMTTYFMKVTFATPAGIMWIVAVQVIGYGANPMLFFALNDEYRKSGWRLLTGKRVAPGAVTTGQPSASYTRASAPHRKKDEDITRNAF